MLNRIKVLGRRIRGFVSRRRLDEEFQQELDSHLEMLTEENLRRGLPPDEAHRTARVQLGGVTQLREIHRELWGLPWLETLLQDLRYALRQLRRNPGFTAVAVLTLALGIGANAGIFSLVDALLLRPLPVKNPYELVGILDSVSFPTYEKLRDRTQLLSGLAATEFFPGSGVAARIDGQAEPARIQMVTGNYYAVLGVDPAMGRLISPEDDQIPGTGGRQGPVAVISYGYWKRRFGLDPSIVGKTIALNGVPVTIVGVTPSQFFGVVVGGGPLDITLPIMLQPRVMPNNTDAALWTNGRQGSELDCDEDYGCGWHPMIGRLKPGVAMAQARAELNVLYRQVLSERAGKSIIEHRQNENRQRKLQMRPAGTGLFRDFSDPVPEAGPIPTLQLLELLAMPVLLLAVACANLATILLARGVARRREVALRLAVGASRRRLIRQLLTESLLLGLMGGALGVALASWGRNLVLALIRPWGSPLNLRTETDVRVLVFAVATTLAAVILFGLVPALYTTRSNLAKMLKDTAGGQDGGHRRLELGKVFVVAQVALSLPLLVGATLLGRSLRNQLNFDPGFHRDNLLLFSTEFQGPDVSRTGTLLKEINQRMAGLPGAHAVGISEVPPPLASGWQEVSVEGIAPAPLGEMHARRALVGPGYLEAAGIPLLAGRDLTIRDNEKVQKACVINAAMAAKFWPGSNPIGQYYTVLSSDSSYKVEVVGVAGNTRGYWLGDDRLPLAYCPMLQYLPVGNMTLLVRTTGSAAKVTEEVKHKLREIDRNLFLEVKTWSSFNDDLEFESIWLSRISNGLSVLALLLTCIGLYGVMAYSVVRRTKEIGIRMALGAVRHDVLWLVLRETLRLVMFGVAVGLAASLGFSRILASVLFGVKPMDPVSFSLAAAILLAVALFAGYLPARRATKVDPMVALRYE